jgi:hypothetical protein
MRRRRERERERDEISNLPEGSEPIIPSFYSLGNFIVAFT